MTLIMRNFVDMLPLQKVVNHAELTHCMFKLADSFPLNECGEFMRMAHSGELSVYRVGRHGENGLLCVGKDVEAETIIVYGLTGNMLLTSPGYNVLYELTRREGCRRLECLIYNDRIVPSLERRGWEQFHDDGRIGYCKELT